MKTRTIAGVVALLAVLGVAGYTAWQLPWVRAWFQTNRVNADEVAAAEKAPLADTKPAPVEVGSPQWRGASRAGVAPAGSFRTNWEQAPPKELWRQPIGGGYGSCSVVGGKLYVQDKKDGQERVVCLNAENGFPVWSYSYDAGQAGSDASYAIGPRATPTVAGNWVYTVGGSGKLLTLHVENGIPTQKWDHELLSEFEAPLPQWGVACSPLLLGDLLIVTPGGKKGAVVAFDSGTGAVRWTAGTNPPGYSSPVAASIGGQDVVFAFMGDALLAVRASDGAVTSTYKWPTQHKGNIATPLVVDNEYVFISSAYKAGCALLRAEKRDAGVALIEVYARRDHKAFQSHLATAVFRDRHLFGTDGERGSNGLRCVTLATGQKVDGWDGSELGQASVILAGDHLLAQTAGGDLMLIEANPKAFKTVGSVSKVLSGKNNWASPTLVDGRIYVRDEQHVVCLDVKP
jgi:outer membrane protein assembly factor BamB